MKITSALRIAAVGAAITVLLSGCGARDKPAAQQPQIAPAIANAASSAKPNEPAPAGQTKAQVPQTKSATIQTYFGDENGTSLIVKQKKITYQAESDKYIAALRALQQSPDSKAVSLFEGFTFNYAALEQGGKLKLDLKLSSDGQFGSPGEELVMEALQKALFQFPEVNEIYITVDGKQVDSLMGHLELPYPIKRN